MRAESRRAGVALLVAVLATSSAALAEPDPGIDAGARAPASLEDVLPPVHPLPEHREVPLPAPTEEQRRRLAALLDPMHDADAATRFAARKAALDAGEDELPAVVARLRRHADSADKLGMKALLKDIRQQARDAIRTRMKQAGETGEVVTPDYLEMLLAHSDRSSSHLQPLTEVVACSRMLEAIGTLPAVRELIGVRARFGEFLRADTQLALARLKDRSTAALIEATRHPAPSIARWAERQLELLGRTEPSDALQTLSPRVQGDVLRAFAKVGRLDTAQLLISYASSENAPVRLAARQAVGTLGEAILWPLRDAYERTLGERAAGEWPWDRVARELFARYDAQRLKELYTHFNRGRRAAHRGDLDAARVAFDAVLVRDPEFEHGPEMAGVYLEHARARADDDREAALLSLTRAERLAPDGPHAKAARSLRYALEAERLLEAGVVDEVLARRSSQLDPDNERARHLLSSLGDGHSSQADRHRYQAAAVIGLLAALGLIVVSFRRRRA